MIRNWKLSLIKQNIFQKQWLLFMKAALDYPFHSSHPLMQLVGSWTPLNFHCTAGISDPRMQGRGCYGKENGTGCWLLSLHACSSLNSLNLSCGSYQSRLYSKALPSLPHTLYSCGRGGVGSLSYSSSCHCTFLLVGSTVRTVQLHSESVETKAVLVAGRVMEDWGSEVLQEHSVRVFHPDWQANYCGGVSGQHGAARVSSDGVGLTGFCRWRSLVAIALCS